jgi:hypothetical protein
MAASAAVCVRQIATTALLMMFTYLEKCRKSGFYPDIYFSFSLFDLSIVRTLFWASARTLDVPLARLLWKRSETRILPLAIKNCPEC